MESVNVMQGTATQTRVSRRSRAAASTQQEQQGTVFVDKVWGKPNVAQKGGMKWTPESAATANRNNDFIKISKDSKSTSKRKLTSYERIWNGKTTYRSKDGKDKDSGKGPDNIFIDTVPSPNKQDEVYLVRVSGKFDDVVAFLSAYNMSYPVDFDDRTRGNVPFEQVAVLHSFNVYNLYPNRWDAINRTVNSNAFKNAVATTLQDMSDSYFNSIKAKFNEEIKRVESTVANHEQEIEQKLNSIDIFIHLSKHVKDGDKLDSNAVKLSQVRVTMARKTPRTGAELLKELIAKAETGNRDKVITFVKEGGQPKLSKRATSRSRLIPVTFAYEGNEYKDLVYAKRTEHVRAFLNSLGISPNEVDSAISLFNYQLREKESRSRDKPGRKIIVLNSKRVDTSTCPVSPKVSTKTPTLLGQSPNVPKQYQEPFSGLTKASTTTTSQPSRRTTLPQERTEGIGFTRI